MPRLSASITAAFSLALASLASADVTTTTLPAPGQPTQTGTPLTFSIIGKSGVSAQQLFLGTEDTIYVVDKTEGNPLQVAGHPAWASEITISTGAIRAMDVKTNSFCAGGNFLGDGRLINAGGNQAITVGGDTPAGGSSPHEYGGDPYDDYDGGAALRLLTPCTDGSCKWVDNAKNYMTGRRWYPSLETLGDGSMFIIGGDTLGGYVNSADQNNPTYEFFPSRGDAVQSQILLDTLPANLYPLTWLLPDGKLFIQTNWGTEILNLDGNKETMLANIPHAVRTYPASGGSVMLPLTPANNYTITLLFCGGSNIQSNGWNPDQNVIVDIPADDSCVTIQPTGDKKWKTTTSLPEGRSMGNFILLPDGNIWFGNGVGMGTAGYGTQDWSIDESYATDPIRAPLIYYPSNDTFSRAGLGNSTVNRMYHSSALLLPDGSVFVAGSNPHADYKIDTTYPTEYRTELFFPWYYFETRPEPSGLITPLSYGGSYFNISLSATDMRNNASYYAPLTKAVVIRTGFSTHAINMGQKYLELQTSYTINLDGSVTLHTSQMPPNSNLFQPGPAVIYVVVDGVPSVGKMIMIGSGKIEDQTMEAVVPLPSSGVVSAPPTSTSSTSESGKPSGTNSGGGVRGSVVGLGASLVAGLVGIGMVFVSS